MTRLPRNPAPAWAKAAFATNGFPPGRFGGVGAVALPVLVMLGVAGRVVVCAALGALSGRLRGTGTVVAATAVVATSAVAAIKARVGIRCFRKPSAPQPLFCARFEGRTQPRSITKIDSGSAQNDHVWEYEVCQKPCNPAEKVTREFR